MVRFHSKTLFRSAKRDEPVKDLFSTYFKRDPSIKNYFLMGVSLLFAVAAMFIVIEFCLGLRIANEKWEKRVHYLDQHLQSYMVYDCNGVPLGRSDRWVAWDEISPAFRAVAFDVEDRDFLKGASVISAKGILRSVVRFLATGKLSGASTIVQQAAKNAFGLPTEKSLSRKFAQIILGYRMKNAYQKPQDIFEVWANTLYFGGGIRGINNASWAFYGVPPSKLTVAESVELCVLWNRPARLFRGRNDFIKRKDSILKMLLDQGYMSSEHYQEGINHIELDRLNTNPESPFAGALAVVSNDARKSGYAPKRSIQSTINSRYQYYAEQASTLAMRKIDGDLGLAPYESASFAERISTYPNMSLIVISKEGGIAAICPSRDFHTSTLDRSLSLVEIGSTIKPFIASLAFEEGWSPDSRLLDSPVSVSVSEKKFWNVKNFRGRYTNADMTIAYGIAISSNVLFTRLVEKLNPSACAAEIHHFGLRCHDHPSLAIGSGVYNSIRNLSKAYIPFINLGMMPSLQFIKKIDENLIGVLPQKRIISERTAYLTRVCLEDAVLQGTGKNFSNLNAAIACKTGTGHHYSRSLCVLLTPRFVVVAMIGFDDSRPMITRSGKGITGASGAGEIIAELLRSCPDLIEGTFSSPKSGEGFAMQSNPYTGEFEPGKSTSILIPKYFETATTIK